MKGSKSSMLSIPYFTCGCASAYPALPHTQHTWWRRLWRGPA